MKDHRNGNIKELYDHEHHQSYQLYNEKEVIKQFHVKLTIKGDKQDDEHEVSNSKVPAANQYD